VTIGRADEGATPLAVRIHNTLDVAPRIVSEMLAVAGRALEPAGISVRWVDCSDGAPGRATNCPMPARGADITVRFVNTRSEKSERQCGTTLRLPAHVPNLVSLSYDCAEHLAGCLARRSGRYLRTETTVGGVLGFTLAHELAHVLLPGSPHSTGGLFQAYLDRGDWDRAFEGRLGFIPVDLVRLREGARVRVGHAVADTGPPVQASPRDAPALVAGLG
jgi:hypothetical protein